MQPIRIGIMIGSDSDLKQCMLGLEFLLEAESKNTAQVVSVITNSIHRNTEMVLENLRIITPVVDVLIVGAGMANHLTGTVDAFLRFTMDDDRVPVIGVAFEGKTTEDTQAAILSIKKVPGTQVIFDENLFGINGFAWACARAVEGNFPKINLPQGKPVAVRTFSEAYKIVQSLGKEGK